MVATDVIEHRVARNLENIILQLFQVSHPAYHLFGLWIAKKEISKAEMLLHNVTQVNIKLLRVLVYKTHALNGDVEVFL